MSKRRTAAGGLAVAALMSTALLVVSAPGTAGGTASAQAAPKVLKIASISSTAIYADVAKGVQARFDDANENQELPGGRTIEYQGMIDDESTTDGTIAAVRQAKEQDGVWAIVGSVAPNLTADYVNQQELPWVGWGINDAFCPHGSKSTWYLYSFAGCVNAADAVYKSYYHEILAEELGGAEGKTVACFGDDSPAGRIGVDQGCAGFEASGFTVVAREATIPASPAVVGDWSPYVQKAMTADGGKPVDVVSILTGAGPVIGFQPALTRASFPGMVLNAVAYAPQLTALMKGATVIVGFATPETASANPEMAEIVASLNAGGIPTETIGQTALSGWFAADMFVKILQEAGKNLTPARFAKKAARFTYEIPNTVGPTVYPNAFASATPCFEFVQSDGTEWSIFSEYQCEDVWDVRKDKPVPYSKVNGFAKY